MRISGFGLYRYELPFTEPVVLKGVTLHRREGLLLRFAGFAGDDGLEGWGEASPLPGFSREDRGEVSDRLREAGVSLVGREVYPEGSLGWMDPDFADLPPSARFGVELAAWNLLSAAGGTTHETMGRRSAETVWLSGLLSGSTGGILADALRMREAGYRAVKLKVGSRTVAEDVRLVHELREVLGDGVALRLDANRAWSFAEAVEFARAARDVRVEYLEEPLGDAALLPRFADETGLPVALDESLMGMDANDLRVHEYARAVVLKPTLLGGVSHVLRLADGARRLGISPVISSAYESGVGMRGLISLSAAIWGEPAGLDTYRRLAADVLTPPLDLNGPRVDVREVLRAGREVVWDRLERVAEL